MKKGLAAVAIMLLMTSCFMSGPGFRSTVVIDYSRYSKVDFFLTESNSVSFEYEAVGSISSVAVGDRKTADREAKERDPERQNRRTPRDAPSYLTVYDALDDLVIYARNRGADGVINLKLDYAYHPEYKEYGYVVSGMAIKRGY